MVQNHFVVSRKAIGRSGWWRACFSAVACRFRKIPCRFRRILGLQFLLLFGAGAPVQQSALAKMAPVDEGVRIDMRIVNQPVADVSSVLSSLSGIPVSVYGALKGSVENWKAEGSALRVFQELGRRTGTFVAYDGTRITMASADELITAIVDLRGRDEAEALETVRAFFPMFPAASVRYNYAVNALVVRGPAPFSDTIEKAFARMSPHIIRIVRFGGMQEVPLQ